MKGSKYFGFVFGWTSILLFEKRENLVATMVLYEIIWKRHTAINQLAEGLKQKDLSQIMWKYPDYFAEKFVASKLPLSAEMLLKEERAK